MSVSHFSTELTNGKEYTWELNISAWTVALSYSNFWYARDVQNFIQKTFKIQNLKFKKTYKPFHEHF